MNIVKLTGNVGNEIVIKDLGHNRLVSFSVAVNESFNNRDHKKVKQTSWYRIVAFGKTAETCEALLSKGKFVAVEGKLRARKYKNKDDRMTTVTEILAFKVGELSNKSAVLHH